LDGAGETRVMTGSDTQRVARICRSMPIGGWPYAVTSDMVADGSVAGPPLLPRKWNYEEDIQ